MYKMKPQRDSTTEAPEWLELGLATPSVERMRNNPLFPVSAN